MKKENKEIKAIRAEIPVELYGRLNKCVKKDYTNITSLVRKLVVDYVRECENRGK